MKSRPGAFSTPGRAVAVTSVKTWARLGGAASATPRARRKMQANRCARPPPSMAAGVCVTLAPSVNEKTPLLRVSSPRSAPFPIVTPGWYATWQAQPGRGAHHGGDLRLHEAAQGGELPGRVRAAAALPRTGGTVRRQDA